MPNSRKWVQQHLDMIAAEGLTVDKVEIGGHIKIKVRLSSGESRLLVVAKTTRDFHALRNNRSIVRRWAKEGK